MVNIASSEGSPMYCLMSARSTNARSTAPVMQIVEMIEGSGRIEI